MRLIFVLVALTAISSVFAEEKPTYCHDVAPILDNNCVTCHRPGQIAPFSLSTYKDAKKHGRLMADIVKRRIMPPWKPVPGYGEFIGERRLTDEQVALIEKWVKAGMPEGNRKDLPEPPTFASGWQLGTPDLILKMPEPYQMPAEGQDVMRNFIVPVEIPDGKYIRAVEYQPSNRRIVHHAVLMMDPEHRARRKDRADGAPGFTQFSQVAQMLPGTLSGWAPGCKPLPLPDGLSCPWVKGADLVLQLHLSPSGKPESEQSTIGIYLTDQPPSKDMFNVMLVDWHIDIPPGEKAYRTRDSIMLAADVDVLGMAPHMHRLGKEERIIARLPNGEEKTLLWINDWNFSWQMFYQNVKPVRLPANTVVVMECTHDNSADNPNNPLPIPQRVVAGEQTSDEMAVAILELMAVDDADINLLASTLRRKTIGRIKAETSPAGSLTQ